MVVQASSCFFIDVLSPDGQVHPVARRFVRKWCPPFQRTIYLTGYPWYPNPKIAGMSACSSPPWQLLIHPKSQTYQRFAFSCLPSFLAGRTMPHHGIWRCKLIPGEFCWCAGHSCHLNWSTVDGLCFGLFNGGLRSCTPQTYPPDP